MHSIEICALLSFAQLSDKQLYLTKPGDRSPDIGLSPYYAEISKG